MSDLTSLSVEISDHVATVVMLERAMGPEFWNELPGVFDELDRNADVRAVIVHGAGDHFTYGLDLVRMMNVLGPLIMQTQLAAGRTELRDLVFSMQAGFNAVAACRKPVIAALHGYCIGGGLDFASACDVRLASADAKISLRETRIAMVADLGSLQRLPGIIGQGWTRRMAFTAEDLLADKALSIGLVEEVFPDRDALLAGARAMAELIVSNPPLAVQGAKQVINQMNARTISEGLDYVATWNDAFLQSEDLGEAMAAFLEKRTPVFKGQ
ncbi:MAG: crotonase/enoyl-CoA hydratase family protein [Proteobacteria bacterium]|nr:crotonase/enoyl-CoA hydratase family protein [Pseudomonadota bacterium]